jgi:hypothetical protein
MNIYINNITNNFNIYALILVTRINLSTTSPYCCFFFVAATIVVVIGYRKQNITDLRVTSKSIIYMKSINMNFVKTCSLI